MAPSVTTCAYQRSTTQKPRGVIKLAPASSMKPKIKPSTLDRYFWYTSSDGVMRLATSTDGTVPEQINTYDFNPALFVREPYPSTFPPGGIWPPEEPCDLLCPLGADDGYCVGDQCYTNKTCKNALCEHSFTNWCQQTENWEDHFELRKTEDLGIGAYTKRAWKAGDVLGWYAGELKVKSYDGSSDYLMQLDIGVLDTSSRAQQGGTANGTPPSPTRQAPSAPHSEPEPDLVYIDAAAKGNWTRFINHSCDPYASYRMRRVGNMRIMTVEAVRDVPADVELTVSYGYDYYGIGTVKVCRCGAENCISRLRGRGSGLKKGKGKGKGRVRVKKCKRLVAPVEEG
ncbi:hypothetical protein BDV95DRAFT_611636 [Massariosphaeria phaeospora]|uniref:SET domain-containing protein n=1 Tax=Massariosphaeria phaeospora TaxID=100035 RepID=A0A7C8M2B8_9PLEO|nr:hypothetical protein BDV95DRAFT_611636 [Massariosphaeria phaeospora]